MLRSDLLCPAHLYELPSQQVYHIFLLVASQEATEKHIRVFACVNDNKTLLLSGSMNARKNK